MPEEGLSGALVREAIQNSLDAKAGKNPVAVRFAFGKIADGSKDHFFQGLSPHLEAQKIKLPASDMRFLAVEDFETRGLHGDPSVSIFEEQGGKTTGKNDFFYFWRNIGRSNKEETERGRWGLGKTVFSASSKISSFFGLTIRTNDGRELLMGQSVGRIHSFMKGAQVQVYEPYGYWAEFQPTDFPLPYEDPKISEEFKKAFLLKRDDYPGLSVVIPFPMEELTAKSLLRETLRNYYLPILQGDLAVAVSDENGTTYLDANSISAIAAQLDWRDMGITSDQMVALLQFAGTALKYPPEDLCLLTSGTVKRAPAISEDRFESSELESLRRKFEQGELIGLRVPVHVHLPQGPKESHFDVFLQRDATLGGGVGEFAREGLTISQGGRPPRGPVRGLLTVSDKPLSTLLGDSENPAHTRWLERSTKLKPYHLGPTTVRLVVKALPTLVDILASPPEEMLPDLLSDTFFLDLPPDDDSSVPGTRRKARDDEGESEDPELPPIHTSPRGFALSITKGGFRINGNPDAPAPALVTVDVAYAVNRGNPFGKYEPFDFELDHQPIAIVMEGAQPQRTEGNRLEFTPKLPAYTVVVTGFDRNRDIEVRVKPSTAGSDA